MAKYKVTIGKEFQIASTKVPTEGLIDAASRAADQQSETGTRKTLSFSILAAILFALGFATFIDVSHNLGDWRATSGVWSAAAFPLGYIFCHYFSRKR